MVFLTRALRALAVVVAILFAPVFGSRAANVDPVTITIATGSFGGLYHPVGGAICKLVNENRHEHGISCTVKITDGSLENLYQLRNGEVAFALTQSDWHFHAVKGTGPFRDLAPFDDLRSVFSVYIEHFTILARDDKDINTFQDLKGKRVFLGAPGSGRRQTMKAIMDAHGWTAADIIDVSEYYASNEAESLCDNEFDAYVYTIGHPNSSVKEALATCRVTLVPVEDKVVDRLVEVRPYYVPSTLPGGLYRDVSEDVPGFGLVATLVTTVDVDPRIVWRVTESLIENLDRLRAAFSAFSTLQETELRSKGLTAPLHFGAAQYFDQQVSRKDGQ